MVVGSLAWRQHPEAQGLRKMARGGAKRCSDSLTLLAAGGDGDTVYGLPIQVKRCPDVRALLRRGLIELRELDEKETKAKLAELDKLAKGKAERAKREAERMRAKREGKIKAALAGMAGKPAPEPSRPKAEANGKRSRNGK